LDLLRKFKSRENQPFYSLTDIPINWRPGSIVSLKAHVQDVPINPLISSPVEPTVKVTKLLSEQPELKVITSKKNVVPIHYGGRIPNSSVRKAIAVFKFKHNIKEAGPIPMGVKSPQGLSKLVEVPIQKPFKKTESKKVTKITSKGDLVTLEGDSVTLEGDSEERPEEGNSQTNLHVSKQPDHSRKLDLEEGIPQEEAPFVNHEIVSLPEQLPEEVIQILKYSWFPLEKVILAIYPQGVSGRRFI